MKAFLDEGLASIVIHFLPPVGMIRFVRTKESLRGLLRVRTGFLDAVGSLLSDF